MTRSAPRLTLMAQEDLRCELFELKKRVHDTASENYLLKVKVRKLQTEVDKKNKQIECLLDPKKSVNVRKIISERGATMIINLKQRNTDLEQALLAKDLYIKRLQTVIDTSKVYSTRETLHKHTTNTPGANLRSRSLSVTPPPPAAPKYAYLKANSDVQLEYVRLAQNLQKIKLANQRPASQVSLKNEFHSNKSLELEDTEPERVDLEDYLVNMLGEMDKMKQTIAELSVEQENMKKVLQEKNSNIETLARRVRHLQRRKYKKPPAQNTNVQPTQLTALQSDHLKQNTDELNKAEPSLTQQETYTEGFEEDSGQKTSLSNDLTSTSSTSSKIVENTDDDDDVQTGDSINE